MFNSQIQIDYESDIQYLMSNNLLFDSEILQSSTASTIHSANTTVIPQEVLPTTVFPELLFTSSQENQNEKSFQIENNYETIPIITYNESHNRNDEASKNIIPKDVMEPISSPIDIKNIKPRKKKRKTCKRKSNEMKFRKYSVHDLNKPFPCKNCAKEFNFKHNLDFHEIIHQIRNDKDCLECPICHIEFKRNATLKGHLLFHEENDFYKCEVCELEFEYKIAYDKHKTECNSVKSNDNDDLLKVLLKQRNRFSIENPNRNAKYKCQICSMSFIKAALLRRHQISHTNFKPYECLECNQRFTQKSSLERHQKAIHSGEKRFKCPKCSIRFTQNSNLINHFKKVHAILSENDEKLKYPCKDCSCVFNKLNSLNRHRSQVHSSAAIINSLRKTTTNEDGHDDIDEVTINNVMNELKSWQNLVMASSHNQELSPENNLTEQTSNLTTEESTKQGFHEAAEIISEDCKSEINENNTEDNNETSKKKMQHYLIKHEIIDGKKIYKCVTCNKTSKRSNDILRHIRVHTEHKNTYKCEKCGRQFNWKFNLKTHMKIHGDEDFLTPNRVYNCYICSNVFNSLKHLDLHIKTLHNDEKLFACSICNKSYKSSRSLCAHTLEHIEKPVIDKSLLEPIYIGSPLQINQNSETSKQINHLKNGETTNDSKRNICLLCDKTFSTLKTLLAHQKLHEDSRRFDCEICKMQFQRKGNLNRHFKMLHENQRNFKCRHCEKVFKTKYDCQRHSMIHFRKLKRKAVHKDESYENEIQSNNYENLSESTPTLENQSNNEFMNYNSQKTRTKFVQLDNSFENNNCLPKNIIVERLENPMITISYINDNQEVHNESESEPLGNHQSTESIIIDSKKIKKQKAQCSCSYCGKEFSKQIDLVRHLRTHTNDKPFKCEICTAAFALKKTLMNHLNTHNKNRPYYDCQVCGKKYASMEILKVHLRIHTGQLPCKCGYCLQSFRTPGQKRTHIKRFHNSITKSKNGRLK